MKNKTNRSAKDSVDELRPEYDFRGAVRRKHYRDLDRGCTVTIHHTDGSTEIKHYGPRNAVALAPDVLKYFPNARAVNHALRSLIGLIPKRAQNSAPASRGTKNGQPSVKKTQTHSRIKSKNINSR
ncbi:MAG: hypothetical protein AAB354_08075 [candidate division KSB1 bacterium]